MNSFGLDRPITDFSEDRFLRKPVVLAIAKEILTAQEGFNFLLSGVWGSGKTSILNLLERELSKDPLIKVIRFNPWKYLQSKDKSSVSRKLLIETRKSLGIRNPESNLYEATTFEMINWYRVIPVIATNLALSIIWFVVVSLFVLGLGLLLKNYFDSSIILQAFYLDKVLLPIIAAFIPLITATIASLKTRSGRAESVEEFEKLFKNAVEHSPYRKIVIFIDDLDRSSESDVQQVLTSIFTTFEHKKCYYIVAADYTVIEPFAGAAVTRKAVADRLDDPQLATIGKGYLKKIFQFIYTIPPLPIETIDDEVKAELDKYG